MRCTLIHVSFISPSGGSRPEELPTIKQGPVVKKNKKNSEKHQRREDLRLTRMMLIIFCCFLLCFLPLMVVNVADDEVSISYYICTRAA